MRWMCSKEGLSGSWLLCGSSSRCNGFVCSLWLWYFLIILTHYFNTFINGLFFLSIFLWILFVTLLEKQMAWVKLQISMSVKVDDLIKQILVLTLNAPIPTKVVCFSRLLKCLKSLHDKQCGCSSDCSYRNSLFWVHAVCFFTWFVSYVRQLFAADDFSMQHF